MNSLLEHTAFDDFNADGKAKSKLLPLILAFDKLKGKNRTITISLKTTRDYYTLYQQLVRAGTKISMLDASGKEVGPQKFAQCLKKLDIANGIDLQDFIEDYYYRQILEAEGVKFSFSQVTKTKLSGMKKTITSNNSLASIGITAETEGDSWEWGTDKDSDMAKQAPEGREVWVIRTIFYEDGYPCMFVYPYEGSQISKYSTALDVFFLERSKENGIIYQYFDKKKFNLLWAACPCTYDWFIEHPVPDAQEQKSAKSNASAEDTFEEPQAEEEADYRMAESVAADRKKLRNLVESYGKADVLEYINQLNEMRTTTTSREQFASQVSDDLDMFMYDEANDNGNEHLDAWFFNDYSGKPETDEPINKYINSRIPGQWEIVQLAGNSTNVGMGIFYEPNYDVYLSLESYDEEEEYITHYDIYLSEDCPWI